VTLRAPLTTALAIWGRIFWYWSYPGIDFRRSCAARLAQSAANTATISTFGQLRRKAA
jgi:hypothetical protein